MTGRRAVLTVLGLGLGWTVLDQVTKYLAVAHLTRLFPADAGLFERLGLFYGTDGLYRLAGPGVTVLAPVWNHVYVQNAAGAFGLLSGAPLAVRQGVFTGVAILAALGLLWMAWRTRGGGALTPLALGLVFGGAVGNLVDRAVHGYVIDFVDWHLGRWHWPAFNVADVGIVVGVFALLLLMNRAPAEASEPEPAAGTSET